MKRIYFTHDNGGRPFKVVVETDGDEKIVRVFAEETGKEILKFDGVKFVIEGNYSDRFVSEKEGRGNTVILQLSPSRFVFIGDRIYEFELDDTVEGYFSMIGNSDVPYPVLLGQKNVYFMLDQKFVPREFFSQDTDWEDAYTEFYDRLSGKSKKMKGIRELWGRM